MKRRLTYLFPKLMVLAACLLMHPAVLLAAGPPKKSVMDNPIAVVLVAVIVALLIVIIALAYVLSGAAQFYLKKYKEEQARIAGAATKTVATVIFCITAASGFAQEAGETAVVKDRSVSGLSEGTFFALMSVIVIELIVILSIAFFLKRLLAKEEYRIAVAAGEAVKKENILTRWWIRANRFRSIKEEAAIDLGHDYDNIRELDNRLPPWWLYGFYLTILFAVIYLWRFEVSHTAPSSLQEYTAAVQKADAEKEEYLKKAANKVDENTVKMLDAGGIESGKTLFTNNCAPCHGRDGGGVVGPNLTDDYWLHGGSLKDIFKTIKYGVQEKGMKSWKDDFSPVQIAQLASFIKTIHGAKVAAPKEPQGELFKETATADSTQKIATITQ